MRSKSPETVSHYKAQVRSYLDMTGAPKGFVGFATTGAVHEVSPSPYAEPGFGAAYLAE